MSPVDYDVHDYQCGHHWPPDPLDATRGPHCCVEVGDHDTHRCCCGAQTLHETATPVAIKGAGDREAVRRTGGLGPD